MDRKKDEFFEGIYSLLDDARKSAQKAINLVMVCSYFEVGRKIVEEEQAGENRAKYGQYIIKELSEYLTKNLGKGFSVTNLKQMRQFYITYADDQIGQTLSDQFSNLPAEKPGNFRAFCFIMMFLSELFCLFWSDNSLRKELA